MSIYPRGSEWRRWDLHVHTPASALNNQFPRQAGNTDWDKYVSALEAVKDVAVLGATDYFSIEGYKRLKQYRSQGKLQNFALLLPNIELRLSTLAGSNEDHTPRRINLHVIFSEEVSEEDIEDHFLGDLRFTYEGNPDDDDERWPVKRSALEELGKKLKDEHTNFRNKSDYKTGCGHAVVNIESVKKELAKAKFRGKHVIVLAEEGTSFLDWDGQDHNVRKTLLQRSHFIFSSNAKTIEWASGKRGGTPEEYIAEFKSLKPCIHGSDAHDIEHICKPDLDRHCWIKADPTFRGLRQVLNEPGTRVYIGAKPPVLDEVASKATKYISNVEIEKTPDTTQGETWFDAEIPLNAGLVSIIGNKGSGKSALADTIALLGHSRNMTDASFLNSSKFLHPKSGKGKHFQARLNWLAGGFSDWMLLSDLPPDGEYDYVKYLPQKYLEHICTELNTGQRTKFDDELETVIFSHIPSSEHLEQDNFADLLELKRETHGETAEAIRGRIKSLNRKIADIESQLTPISIATIQKELEALRLQLKSLEAKKPNEVKPADDDPSKKEEREKAITAINKLDTEISELEKAVKGKEKELAKQNTKLNDIARLRALVKGLQSTVQETKEEWLKITEGQKIDYASVVQFTTNTKVLAEHHAETISSIKKLESDLDPEQASSVKAQLIGKQKELGGLREKLEEPLRVYEAYKKASSTWKKKVEETKGDKSTPGTIAYLEEQFRCIPSLEQEREQLFDDRDELMRKLLSEIAGEVKDFRELYAPVQKYVSEFSSEQSVDLELDVSIVERGFIDQFYQLLNFGKQGEFYGRDEGSKKIRQMLASTDFNSVDETIQFIHEMLDALSAGRNSDSSKRRITDQLKKDVSSRDVYNYLTELSFLTPTYKLTWGGVPLDQLSPGERGTVLLVFYLLVDKSDVPLIIDQPEENLDNETVYKILCSCIVYAKNRRQIIIVTHNPNLAVVCDSEQIIHAEIDKQDGNRITYTSGSIENAEINSLIVKVLEGTRPAFDNRDAKYRLVPRGLGDANSETPDNNGDVAPEDGGDGQQ